MLKSNSTRNWLVTLVAGLTVTSVMIISSPLFADPPAVGTTTRDPVSCWVNTASSLNTAMTNYNNGTFCSNVIGFTDPSNADDDYAVTIRLAQPIRITGEPRATTNIYNPDGPDGLWLYGRGRSVTIIDASNLGEQCAIYVDTRDSEYNMIQGLTLRVRDADSAFCDQNGNSLPTTTSMTTFMSNRDRRFLWVYNVRVEEISTGIVFVIFTDTDRDGVADSDDNCPNTRNPNQADRDTDGLGDVCDTAVVPPTGDEGSCSVLTGIRNADGVVVLNYESENIDSGTIIVTQGGVEVTSMDYVPTANDIAVSGPAVVAQDVTYSVSITGSDGTVYQCGSVTIPGNSGGGGGGGGGEDCLSVTSDCDDDEIIRSEDNCPEVTNRDQADADNDGDGNACDEVPGVREDDTDGDGVRDSLELENGTNPEDADSDDDGLPDGVEAPYDKLTDPNNADTDGDGICDGPISVADECTTFNGHPDNCPIAVNEDQKDEDQNGVGDKCEGDMDADGVLDADDNCPVVSNGDQANADGDEFGDACEPALSESEADSGGCGCIIPGSSAPVTAANMIPYLIPLLALYLRKRLPN